MRRQMVFVALTAALFASVPLSAQAVVIKEEKPGLLKKAVIKSEVATASALAKVPGGKIQSAEIEEEDGKLIYSFDIKVTGKSGIEEVAVDAKTGAVTVEHETPANEAKEAKEDAAKAKAAAKAKPATPPKPPAKQS
ncbi:MAG: PepSY domain-containing protein [Gemmatimonadaceae bacterium]